MGKTTDVYQLQVDVKDALSGLSSLKTAVKGFIGVLAVREVADFGRAIIESTKKFQQYENQLRLITRGSEDLARVSKLLAQAAVETRTSYGDIITLFTRLSVSTETLGVSEERVINVTKKLSQALQVAGADGNTAASVIRQFGQAMASGEVRGDEFRSLVEGLGPALAIMARESGLTVGKLRAMSQNGELTAETMFKILENTKALTVAFNQMNPTLDQLETQLSDAFDRALNKLGEVTGATSVYQKIIKELTMQFNDFAGETIRDLPIEKILEDAKKGTLDLGDSIDELNRRYLKLLDVGFLDVILNTAEGQQVLNGTISESLKQYKLQIEALKELKRAADEKAAKDKADLDNLTELNKKLNELLQPYQKYIKLSEGYMKLELGTPLEKAIAKQKEAQQVLEKLKEAQDKINQSGFNKDKLKDLTSEIKAAEAALADYTRKVNELTGLTGFTVFYQNLIKDSKDASAQLEYAKEAVAKLKQELASGVITNEVYTAAMKKVVDVLDKANEGAKRLAESVGDYSDKLNESVKDAQFELDTLNMNALDKQLADIDLRFRRDLTRQIKELKKLQTPENSQEIEKAIQKVTEATEVAIAKQKQIAEQVYEQQRTFEYGWSKAFEEYADNATNAAKKAEEIFQATTRSMEDAIVSFVKTGKFEFKSLINDILEQLLRSQIQQVIAQVFSLGGGKGGGGSALGRLFGGFFASGGFLPSGKWGVAGENGPELITGPAQITPLQGMGGTSNVTYNINAVDAASFKQMVARDPGFIHSVAQQGARKVPVRR